MSEGEGEEQVPMTAGERLRAAREAADMTIEDVATTTRIPTRHLTSLETGDYSKLPAPTYSVGFARSYAAAVGIDRNEIGEQVRAELGGTRLAPHQVEAFEPIDPARTMPRWLIFAVIGGIFLVVLLASWLHNRSLNAPDNLAAAEAQPTDAATAAAPVAAAPQPARPVAITAIDDAWVQIKDGPTMLKEGVMVQLRKYNGNPIGVQLPMFVELDVVYAEPAARGDTSSGSGTKIARLETGMELRVPPFIKEGEKLKIATETKEFAGRV